jgi:excinuclease ABC subunit B
MYADKVTGSMDRAISETNRRRKIQEEYNNKHGVTPTTIRKKIAESMSVAKSEDKDKASYDISQIPTDELDRLVKSLERKMDLASKNLEFEQAAKIRDQISEIRAEVERNNFKNKLKKS